MTESADNPLEETQEPKRIRRRWLWAVLITHLLFAVSVACWWQWPRGQGDPRFVGKWGVLPTGATAPNADLHLKAKGTGSFRFRGPGSITWSLKWRTEGTQLILGRPLTAAESFVAGLTKELTGVHTLSRPSIYQVSGEGKGEIHFQIPLEARGPGCQAALSYEGRLVRLPQ